MGSARKKTPASPKRAARLAELEERAAERGIHLHYDLLEAAGLKLKGGLCRINGEYHFFIDRRKPVSARIEIIEDLLDRPLPEKTPDHRAPEPAAATPEACPLSPAKT
ncbi:MAG: hypothetical protein DRH56_04010 [Deltaproteobacteria bacterium]|nr:MAG: hypothetical protein DRH56_04010 [Deltaproteobacteria bacterium]